MRGMGLAGKYPDMFDAYEAPYEVAELTIDICVCTYRRPSIEDTLRSLDRQTLPDGVSARAIVIDNDETPSARDRVEAIAANLSMPVKYIHAPANNISIARNAGLDAATAQWIAFIDDDEVAEPDWLASLLQMARVNSLDAVFGPAIAVYPETAPNWMRQQDYHSNVPVRRGGVVQTGHTCNALMRASSPIVKGQRFLIEKGNTGGEDTEFFFRLWYAGAKFGISEAAIVHEAVDPKRLDSEWIRQRKFRSGMSFGYHSLTTRNTVTLTITVLASLAKIVFCYAMAGIFFWSTQKRNFWAMRGVFHRGWLASAFSTKEPELY
ncbi:glycosyltransferase family 2 protein [uncultured Hyphomonas sp.]|uniref:glycosyltransferase family 2 protein n=2 Tax=Bacteria TaxID=2 RepID=UPI0026097E67|nr:glycosyltransferase family 2 protein [uncultured Hyphomonas sp.]